MSPLDEAFHDWADAHEGAPSRYDAFVGGWEARQQTLDVLHALCERQRHTVDRALAWMGVCAEERAAFKRQRDELARALMEASRG